MNAHEQEQEFKESAHVVAFGVFLDKIVSQENSLASILEHLTAPVGWAHDTAESKRIEQKQQYVFQTKENLKNLAQLILFIKKNRAQLIHEFNNLNNIIKKKCKDKYAEQVRPHLSEDKEIVAGNFLSVFVKLYAWSIDPLMSRFRNPDFIGLRSYTEHEKSIAGFIRNFFVELDCDSINHIENYFRRFLNSHERLMLNGYLAFVNNQCRGVFARAHGSITTHCTEKKIPLDTPLQQATKTLEEISNELNSIKVLPDSVVKKLQFSTSRLLDEIKQERLLISELDSVLGEADSKELIALYGRSSDVQKRFILECLEITEQEILSLSTKHPTAEKVSRLKGKRSAILKTGISVLVGGVAALALPVSAPVAAVGSVCAGAFVGFGLHTAEKKLVEPVVSQEDLYKRIQAKRCRVRQYSSSLNDYAIQLTKIKDLLRSNDLSLSQLKILLQHIKQTYDNRWSWFKNSTWKDFCDSAQTLINEINKLELQNLEQPSDLTNITRALGNCNKFLERDHTRLWRISPFSLYRSCNSKASEIAQPPVTQSLWSRF